MTQPASMWTRSKRFLPALLLLCVVGFLGLAIQTYASPQWLKDGPTTFKAAFPVVYIVVVAGCMISGLTPSLPVIVLGGQLFHWIPGAIYTILGAMIGTTSAYWLARWGGRPAVIGLVGEGKLAWIEGWFANGLSFRAIVLLRLIPHPLYDAVNYLCGLLGVPFKTYAAATAIGGLPGCILLPLLGEKILHGGITLFFILWLLSGVLLFSVLKAKGR